MKDEIHVIDSDRQRLDAGNLHMACEDFGITWHVEFARAGLDRDFPDANHAQKETGFAVDQQARNTSGKAMWLEDGPEESVSVQKVSHGCRPAKCQITQPVPCRSEERPNLPSAQSEDRPWRFLIRAFRHGKESAPASRRACPP